MRKEVTHFCRSCETCASCNVGRPIKPYLTPIPVAGPFDRVGVDMIKLFPAVPEERGMQLYLLIT